MKDTNKVVLGVASTFVVVSAIAVSQGGSVLVSAACTLAAIALSLAYKYKCERDNNLDILEFLMKAIAAKDSKLQVLENLVMSEVNKVLAKDDEFKEVEVAKKPRKYKSKPKTEVIV